MNKALIFSNIHKPFCVFVAFCFVFLWQIVLCFCGKEGLESLESLESLDSLEELYTLDKHSSTNKPPNHKLINIKKGCSIEQPFLLSYNHFIHPSCSVLEGDLREEYPFRSRHREYRCTVGHSAFAHQSSHHIIEANLCDSR